MMIPSDLPQASPASARRSGRDPFLFLKLWLKNPLQIAAVAPSSRGLARAMAAQIADPQQAHVLELGPGTGALTRGLIEAGIRPDRIVAVERDPTMLVHLATALPAVRVIAGSAADVAALLPERKLAEPGTLDATISGLPLVAMPRPLQDAIMEGAFHMMKPTGRFIQFTYGWGAPLPRVVLAEHGCIATRRAWIAGNIPPASVWTIERGDPAASAPAR